MDEPIHIGLYSDIQCPYAYVTIHRLRQLQEEYRDRVVVDRKCLSLEYVNRQPTPKRVIENETPFLMLLEPEIPYQPWHRPDSEWPVTMWPAFEAVKCAERQGSERAVELDWAIRAAFFAESQCVSMRHVLFDLAEQVGLDMARFRDDFDSGVAKRLVIEESREGWERLKVDGSPSFVLPDGRHYSGLGLPEVEIDESQHGKVVGLKPASCAGSDCLDLLRSMFDEALAQ